MSARRVLAASRPRFWLYLAGPALVGLAFGAPSPAALASPLALALLVYFGWPANAFLYGVNDVFDADADRENPRKAGVETRFAGERSVVLAAAVGAAAGVALLPWLPPLSALAVAGFLVLGAAYSAPPLRLKTRPPLDSLSNGLYVLPGVAAYVAVAGTAPPALAVAGGWLWTMGMHTFSAVPDVEPDRRAGLTTTATTLGAPLTLAYCAVTWLLAAALFAALDPRLGALLLVYPAVAVVIRAADLDVGRAYGWFPRLNATVGMALTLGGLWRFAGG